MQAKSKLTRLVGSAVQVDRLVLKTIAIAERRKNPLSDARHGGKSGGIAAFPTR
jgi:hypothetical protein